MMRGADEKVLRSHGVTRRRPTRHSSTLFHLLYRFRTEFGRSDEHRWIRRYGFEEHTVGKPDDDAVEDGRNSRRRK